MRLEDNELNFIIQLIEGTVPLHPENSTFTGQEVNALLVKLKAEKRSRVAVIPANWRELAIAHALEQEPTVYTTPGVAGGVKAPKPGPAKGKYTPKLSLDDLLMIDVDVDFDALLEGMDDDDTK